MSKQRLASLADLALVRDRFSAEAQPALQAATPTPSAGAKPLTRRAAYVAYVAGRRLRGFVVAAGIGVLELTNDRDRAWGFTSATEARGAVNLALGLGAKCYELTITTVRGQA